MKSKAPIGLDSLCHVEKLPILRTYEMSEQQSSYDFTGGNADALYGDKNGGGPNTVLMNVNGPGTITRIWVTGCGGDGTMDFYFDGEETPSLHILIPDLFSGKVTPFEKPLSEDNEASSGGFISYVPIGFQKSMKVVGNGVGYYHIGYQIVPYGTPVENFTGKEDYNNTVKIWNHCGQDPKPQTGNTNMQSVFSLPSCGKAVVADVEGPGSIASIKLNIPAVKAVADPEWVHNDDGRSHEGSSSFQAKIDPNNQGIVIRKRLDQYCEQQGRIFIDGREAGVWTTPAGPDVFRFKDSEYTVPADFTAGKSEITIRSEYISSLLGYGEYHYWIDSVVDGKRIRTDELDVGEGHLDDESAHNYKIEKQKWAGPGIMGFDARDTQPPEVWENLARMEDILNTVWIQIRWDGEAEPSVDAPIGSFFGFGAFGARPMKAILFGMDDTDTMYSYFPMPFKKSARITLVNKGNQCVENMTCSLSHNRSYSEDMGTFKTQYRDFVAQRDIPITILETEGRGHLAGVVESRAGYVRFFLEGDEIVNVDGNKTHCIHGTGTEDFYNGGWYFDRGVFALPQHGSPAHNAKDNKDRTAMYRTFISDPVIFRDGIKMTIEHGGWNETNIDVKILAMYYHSPKRALIPADAFTLEQEQNRKAHAYRSEGKIREITIDGRLEGNHIKEKVSAKGEAVRGTISFRIQLPAENKGLLLRRLTDLSVLEQRVQIFVDGDYAGGWNNRQTRGLPEIARYEDLIIGKAYTEGKDAVDITLTTTEETEWIAYGYEAYAII